MREHGLDKIVFYSVDELTEDQFLAIMKQPVNLVHVVYEKDSIVAIVWLNRWGSNYAFAHFCCFPEIWGTRSLDAIRLSLHHWFNFQKDDRQLLDVIMGEIPAVNIKAIKFTERLGFTNMGTVPEIRYGDNDTKKVGATFLYLTREDFK